MSEEAVATIARERVEYLISWKYPLPLIKNRDTSKRQFDRYNRIRWCANGTVPDRGEGARCSET